MKNVIVDVVALAGVFLMVVGAEVEGASSPSTAAPKVPALFAFGDSIVDTGNNNYIPTFTRSNFKPYGRDFPGHQPTGRFSDGEISMDFLGIM